MSKEAEAHLRRGSEFLAVLERQNLKHPDILKSAQQAVECFAQAIYTLLELRFPLDYESLQSLPKEDGLELLQAELRRIGRLDLPLLYPYADLLPKIVFLASFWSGFREQAETGAQALKKPVSLFFGREEARVALEQARLCHKAAKSLLELKRESPS